MLNTVTEAEDFPAAVLIRAMLPVEGQATIARRRGGGDTLGPGKITQALGIDGSLNGLNLCTRHAGLWIESGEPVDPRSVLTGARVGLNTVPEPWKSIAWRFRVKIR
jgi:DNA-3-methyladenine glycosylase